MPLAQVILSVSHHQQASTETLLPKPAAKSL